MVCRRLGQREVKRGAGGGSSAAWARLGLVHSASRCDRKPSDALFGLSSLGRQATELSAAVAAWRTCKNPGKKLLLVIDQLEKSWSP